MAVGRSVEAAMAAACVTFQTADIPAAVLKAVEECIIDWLGCAVIGAREKPTHAMIDAYRADIGHGPATLMADGLSAPANLAALINATAAHTIELDDIYSPGLYHPGAPVIAAALAAAQLAKADGRTLLRAVVAGYEISNRLAASVNPSHYEFWHTTGTIGTIGATVASCVALGLDENHSAHALAHAASLAAGLQQAFRSDGMTKPLHAGRAADTGLLAARISAHGFTGSTDMFSGPVGFVTAMSDASVDPGAFDDLLSCWTIARNTYKRFSACGHTFAAVDAAMDVLDERAIPASDVRSIEIASYAKAIEVAGIARPQTPFEAKFSLAFGVSAAICGHDLTNPVSYETLYNDPSILALCERTTLIADPDITARFPGLRGAAIRIHLSDGSVVSKDMVTRKGDPDNPLSGADLERKFMRLAEAAGVSAAPLLTWAKSLKQGGRIDHAALSLAILG